LPRWSITTEVCSAANVCLIILTKSFTRTALRLEANYIKSQVVSAYCSPIYRVGLVPAKSNKNNISLRVGLCLECPNFTGKVRPKQQKIVVNVGVGQYHCKAHLAYIGPLSLSLCACVYTKPLAPAALCFHHKPTHLINKTKKEQESCALSCDDGCQQ
jgi:hypothetical protein